MKATRHRRGGITSSTHQCDDCCQLENLIGGTTAAAPPPFRPGNPALCGSHPL